MAPILVHTATVLLQGWRRRARSRRTGAGPPSGCGHIFGKVQFMMGFVFRLIPPRPSFSFDMSTEERATMMEHVEYWSALTREGRVLAFGPVGDPREVYGI